jgi:hypothetical protein
MDIFSWSDIPDYCYYGIYSWTLIGMIYLFGNLYGARMGDDEW